MKRFGRKRAEEHDSIDPVFDERNVVTSFRQRLREDPEFKTGFVRAMMAAREEADQLAIAESKEHADDYFGESVDFPDSVHVARSQTYTGLIDLLYGLSHTETPSDSEEFLRSVRGEIGTLASEAYFQGQIQTPPTLKAEGALGYVDPEIGLVVAWDRVKNMDTSLMLDNVADTVRRLNLGD